MLRKITKYSQKKIFISIGAGINQIPLIDEAKALGFYVIGIDRNPEAPGFIKCDLKIHESIENYEIIHKILGELPIVGKIYGIITKSYGPALKTTSYLSEKYNIPFFPFSRHNDFINKKMMKKVFIKNNILTPSALNISSKSNHSGPGINKFPIIIKPRIGHAKTDVKLINSNQELKAQMKKLKEHSHYIFEKYIEGDEIISIGIIHKGKYYLIDMTDKKTTPHPYFVDTMHISPSKYYYLSDEISKIGQLIADSFEIKTSPLVMEFIISDDEDLYIIEAVPEFGGEFIPDILIPAKTGYNFIKETIKAATNLGFKPPKKLSNKKAVIINYITGKDGILLSFNPEGPASEKNIIFSKILKEKGSKIRKPATNLDRIGVVISRGKTVDEARSYAKEAAKKFRIRIKNK